MPNRFSFKRCSSTAVAAMVFRSMVCISKGVLLFYLAPRLANRFGSSSTWRPYARNLVDCDEFKLKTAQSQYCLAKQTTSFDAP
jgi:hypothetical protein